MTTFSGLWGTEIIRGNGPCTTTTTEILQARRSPEELEKLWSEVDLPGILQDDARDIFVVPSNWGEITARQVQSEASHEGPWDTVASMANRWLHKDAAKCGPRYTLVVEMDYANAILTMLEYRTGDRLESEFFPGMGFAAALWNVNDWAMYLSSVIRQYAESDYHSIDVLVVQPSDGDTISICEMLCATLKSYGVMSYPITIADMVDLLREEDHLAEVARRAEEITSELNKPPKKPWRQFVGWGISGTAIVIVLALFIAFVVTHRHQVMEGSGRQHVDSSSRITVTDSRANSSVSTEARPALAFPGGFVQLPAHWTVSESSVQNPIPGEWRRHLTTDQDDNVRIVLVVQDDSQRRLLTALHEDLQGISSTDAAQRTVSAWPHAYRDVPGGPEALRAVGQQPAMSYQERTGVDSAAKWIVLYGGPYAVSFGCQYRLRGAMTEDTALRQCATVLRGLRTIDITRG